jgi:hypothetical protein
MKRLFSILCLVLIVFAGCEGLLNTTTPYPEAPSRVEVVDLTPGSTTLTWHDNATNEGSYEVECLVRGDSAFVSLATLPADSELYTDPLAEPGVAYSYRVRAVSGAGRSTWTYSRQVSPAFIDPDGDTTETPGKYAYDISRIEVDPASSTITISFTNTVYPPDYPWIITELPRPVVGVLELDVDRTAATGVMPAIDMFGPEPPSGMGADYTVDLWSPMPNPDGSYSAIITNNGGGDPCTATVTYAETSLTITMPGSTIDLEDGVCDVAVVIGTIDEPTDEAGPLGFR